MVSSRELFALLFFPIWRTAWCRYLGVEIPPHPRAVTVTRGCFLAWNLTLLILTGERNKRSWQRHHCEHTCHGDGAETKRRDILRFFFFFHGSTNAGCLPPTGKWGGKQPNVMQIMEKKKKSRRGNCHYVCSLTCCWTGYPRVSRGCCWGQSESWRARRSPSTGAGRRDFGPGWRWRRGQASRDSSSDLGRRFERSSPGPCSRWARLRETGADMKW